MEIEHFFICPFCWQSISMLLDLSESPQTYVEDCEVCCRPIQLYYTAEPSRLKYFEARAVEQ